MSQPVLNSNANSALLNTLLNTESLRISPEYSTKVIDYPHATNYTKIDAPASTIAEGSQVTIQLLKYGIASQILLNYTKIVTPPTSGTDDGKAGLQAGDIFRVINRVELMSSSRVISTITSEGLQAQIAGLTQSQLIPIYQNAVRERDYDPAQTGATGNGFAFGVSDPTPNFKFALPLRFGLLDQSGILNLGFLENCSIRITFGKLDYCKTGTFTAGNLKDLFLKVRYEVYPEEAMAQIISANYNENDLNVLSSRFYLENPVQQNFLLDASQGAFPLNLLQKGFVDIKNVDVVSKFYIIVRNVGQNPDNTATRALNSLGTGNNLSTPYKISGLALFASGQEILRLNDHEIEYTQMEPNGLAVANSGRSAAMIGTGCGLQNIAILPMGKYTNDMTISNAISLRELNNCRLEVQWYGLPSNGPRTITGGTDITAQTKFQIDVVEETLAIYNIASSTGRIGLSLAN